MAKVLIILLLALVLEALGVVFLSKGIKQLDGPERITAAAVARLVGRGLANPNILLGVALEAVFFASLLYLLSQRDVTLIWPLTSLGFVITAIAARFLLHEHVSPMRWAGVLLIVFGALLVTWSEKSRTLPAAATTLPPPPAPSVTSNR